MPRVRVLKIALAGYVLAAAVNLPDCRGGCGTIFSLTPAGVETVLHSFGGFPGGRVPQADLLAIGNKLYGTAARGGYPPPATTAPCSQ